MTGITAAKFIYHSSNLVFTSILQAIVLINLDLYFKKTAAFNLLPELWY